MNDSQWQSVYDLGACFSKVPKLLGPGFSNSKNMLKEKLFKQAHFSLTTGLIFVPENLSELSSNKPLSLSREQKRNYAN